MGVDMREDIKEIYFTEQQIADKVAELGARITADYRDRNPLIVSVLKGSYVFMADLTRKIDTPSNIDFMVVSSYGKGTETTGEVQIIKDIEQPIDGRDLLIVEDILDTGYTLEYLVKNFKSRGTKSVETTVLLEKPERHLVPVDLKYVGFTVPDVWVVGYGLDYGEQYRTLPYIAEMKR